MISLPVVNRGAHFPQRVFYKQPTRQSHLPTWNPKQADDAVHLEKDITLTHNIVFKMADIFSWSFDGFLPLLNKLL